MPESRTSRLGTAARPLLALGAALALADASVVTLALPEILDRLDTTIAGLAAVIGVYTVILAGAVLAAVPASRWLGARAVGALGLLLFAVASVMCGVSDGLTGLLVSRGLQAVGAGLGLLAAYDLLSRGSRTVGDDGAARPARLWVAAAIFGTAIGPALGGALTEAFDWRAIFLAQAPFGLLAALACLVVPAEPAGPSGGAAHPPADPTTQDPPSGPALGRPRVPARPPEAGRDASRPVATGPTAGGRAAASSAPHGPGDLVRAGVALALLSAALTAVVFLLVLLLVTGWDVQPLKAAVAVTILPLAALAGSRIPGDPWLRASAGCALVGAGVLALASLPTVGAAWVVLPQLLSGVGMGMALPALAGGLLPERTPRQAAVLLSVRHVGITVALLALAPVITHQLDRTEDHLYQQVTALVLDANLPLEPKVKAIGGALGGVSTEDPRGSLRTALDGQAPKFASNAGEKKTYAGLTDRSDEVLVLGVTRAFRGAFLITGGLALIAALLVVPLTLRRLSLAAVVAAVALALAGGQALVSRSSRPAEVAILDPCKDRKGPEPDGIIQGALLDGLDRAACKFGSSREDLALALAIPSRDAEYDRRYGVNPRKDIAKLVSAGVGLDPGGTITKLVEKLLPGDG